MCKIGCTNIATEVLLLSLHLAYPQEGHLDAALHAMGYLRLKYNSGLSDGQINRLTDNRSVDKPAGRNRSGHDVSPGNDVFRKMTEIKSHIF
jgi:hypothetical protein